MLYLSFAAFYQAVLHRHTSLTQYDTVRFLLTGGLPEDDSPLYISSSVASKYVSGKKPISKTLLSKLALLTTENLKDRLHLVAIQNPQCGYSCIKTLLLNRKFYISDRERGRLLHVSRNSNDPYDFLAEVFFLAIRCPSQNIKPLTEADLSLLDSETNYLLYGDDPDTVLSPDKIAESEAAYIPTAVARSQSSKPVNYSDYEEVLAQSDLHEYYRNVFSMPEKYNDLETFCSNYAHVPKETVDTKHLAKHVRDFGNYVHTLVIRQIVFDFFNDPSDVDGLPLPKNAYPLYLFVECATGCDIDDAKRAYNQCHSVDIEHQYYIENSSLESGTLRLSLICLWGTHN